jgi:hypothetical protein
MNINCNVGGSFIAMDTQVHKLATSLIFMMILFRQAEGEYRDKRK